MARCLKKKKCKKRKKETFRDNLYCNILFRCNKKTCILLRKMGSFFFLYLFSVDIFFVFFVPVSTHCSSRQSVYKLLVRQLHTFSGMVKKRNKAISDSFTVSALYHSISCASAMQQKKR